VVGCGICALAAAAPWSRSGSVSRSGYRLLGVATGLRVQPTWGVKALLVGLAGLPVLTAVAWLAAALRRPRLVPLAAVVAGAVGSVSAVAVLRSPLPTLWGAPATLGAGLVTLAIGAVALAGRGDGNGRRAGGASEQGRPGAG
jgi:hypothetical protein